MADPVKVARDISKIADGGIVLIGGVATYLHVQRRPKANLPLETTHDTDAAVSSLGMGSIRDALPVTTNVRLHKEQVEVDDVEVDLYPAHISRLRFDYGDLAPYAQKYRGFRIASIPHLLLLKLDALSDRGRSAKGAKDRRDVIKLLVLLDGSPQARTLLAGLAAPADLRALSTVAGSPAFMDIAKGNAKTAAELRAKAQRALDAVEKLP